MPSTATDDYPFDKPQPKAEGDGQNQVQEEAKDCSAENAKGQTVSLCQRGWQSRIVGKDGKCDKEWVPCPICRPKAHAEWANPPVQGRAKRR